MMYLLHQTASVEPENRITTLAPNDVTTSFFYTVAEEEEMANVMAVHWSGEAGLWPSQTDSKTFN